MSTTLRDSNGVSITRYSLGLNNGYGYQVTWGLGKYVSFDNEESANQFAELLEKAIEK